MQFSELARYLQKLEQTSSRNLITEYLAEILSKTSMSEADKVCYLLLGRIAPQYTGIEFNLAEKMMIKAIALAYNVDQKLVSERYKKVGDLGNVAEKLAKGQRRKDLSINKIYQMLYETAVETGVGSQERKLAKMAEVLSNVDALSARYIVRIPLGKLRLGFSDITILDALSILKKGDKSARKQIEAAYNVTADIGKIAVQVQEKGLKSLAKIKAQPGVPIRASLAERLDSAEKIIEKVGPKVAIEPKLDGFRIAVHIWQENKKKQVRLFSRNQENVTYMFPDIVKAAKKLRVKSAIFDGEAIGYNPKTGEFYPFQETVQRKRKYGISEAAKNIPLKVFVFDILYLNGRTLLDKPFFQRRRILEKVLGGSKTDIVLTEQHIVEKAAEFKKLAHTYIKEGLEGAVAKKLDVAYQAGARGYHWVKYKKHTEGGLADTIDCVLMGAFYGRGKRAGFGVGGFLLGVREKEKYYTISNLGTGLTDAQFRQMRKTIEALAVDKKPKEYVVDKLAEPDIWVRPKVVLEILADEITISPRHTAGRGRTGKGYSLRFPRLIRVREDKNPEDATTVAEVKKLYKLQHK